MKMAHEMTIEERRRADQREREARNSRNPAVDIAMQELAAAREQNAENQRVLYDMMNRRPETSHADHLLGKFMDNESVRITQLRAQHESEMRTKNDLHRDEIERIHARNDQNAKWQQTAHEREMTTLTRTMEHQEKMLTTAHASEVRALTRENESLRTKNDRLEQEISELRAKKDKGLIESLTEITTVKEALEGFSPPKEEGSGSTIERIISGVMESPLAEGIASRVAGGAAATAMGAQPGPQGPAAAPPPGAIDPSTLPVNQPVPMPDGNVIVRKGDGRIVMLKPKRQPQPGEIPEIKVDPTEVKMAVSIMESACEKDVDPESFALSARTLVPAEIIRALRVQGVDHFLANVAKLDNNSPLQTMHGKNWVRKVAQVLVGG
jgi:hypothetical protein